MVSSSIQACQIEIKGAVQGVGFRPCIFRLCGSLGLTGYIQNTSSGVRIVIEGQPEVLSKFRELLPGQVPSAATIQNISLSPLAVSGFDQFVIKESEVGVSPQAIVLADLATCQDCCRDIEDPQNRRYQYPFTNCTQCGPRYSILESLPYDRSRTTMKRFSMCPECEKEFTDPGNRRFHAQPNACVVCGPQLALWDKQGTIIGIKGQALHLAVESLRAGKILALKGLGGFQLIVDAANEEAVRALRQRKHREEKPFALMFPSLQMIKDFCEVSSLEEQILCSSACPIVLLKKRKSVQKISSSVAFDQPCWGAMLAYTPLHILLMKAFGAPVIATSGNISQEPICIDERDALEKLGLIADVFLVHDRPIVRPMDDSIVRVMDGKVCILRRARGYAPLPVRIPGESLAILGVGAFLKNTAALKIGENVFISQHIGDLGTESAAIAFETAVKDLSGLYQVSDIHFACDLHPDYESTRFAKKRGHTVIEVGHHHAHMAGVIAEHGIQGLVLGLIWDGTGLGEDGTIWGGEILLGDCRFYERFGHLRSFSLPGGDSAVEDVRKSALGVLYELSSGKWEIYLDLPCFQGFSDSQIRLIHQVISQGRPALRTSSMGRLFDAVSALTGTCLRSNFEGQAAMKWEYVLVADVQQSYECKIIKMFQGQKQIHIFDWAPMIHAMIADIRAKIPMGIISAKFHNTLIEWGVKMAHLSGARTIVLSGGCFQNRYLLENCARRLRQDGCEVFYPQQVPMNDGGIALGQVAVAVARLEAA